MQRDQLKWLIQILDEFINYPENKFFDPGEWIEEIEEIKTLLESFQWVNISPVQATAWWYYVMDTGDTSIPDVAQLLDFLSALRASGGTQIVAISTQQ